ncbi:MAG: pilus assembly protein PilP [Smithella sp.]
MKKITFFILTIIFAGMLSTDSLIAAEATKVLPLPPPKAGPVQQQVQAPQPQVPSVPVIPPAESTYSYNPAGKPDPFQPFVEEEVAAKKKAEKKKASSIFPLQRIEVEQFKLVGIAGDPNRRVAMVEDVAKKFYPLSVGTCIGLNNGKVVEILPDRVIVEEYKAKKTKRIILKLHKN